MEIRKYRLRRNNREVDSRCAAVNAWRLARCLYVNPCIQECLSKLYCNIDHVTAGVKIASQFQTCFYFQRVNDEQQA